MHIKIAERLKPFSHLPGTTCLIPLSAWQVQIFPTLLRFSDMMGKQIALKLGLLGPMRDFTIELDLENALIRVFGHTARGYVRYQVVSEEKNVVLHFEKTPPEGVEYHLSSQESPAVVKNNEKISIAISQEPIVPVHERLSLGMHKAQDWEMVCRRKDAKEIFPIWLRLSELTPVIHPPVSKVGTLLLLAECENIIASRERNDLVSTFMNLFQAGFYGIFTPRLIDDQFQGFVPDLSPVPANLSPIVLIKRGAALIRSFFFQESEAALHLLPALPPEFHAGRFVALQCQDGSQFDLEWTKKLLRRAVLRAARDRQVVLVLQKPLKSFRLRRSLKDKGEVLNASDPFKVKAGEIIFLDRFQK